jgi:hypothetical protein
MRPRVVFDTNVLFSAAGWAERRADALNLLRMAASRASPALKYSHLLSETSLCVEEPASLRRRDGVVELFRSPDP